jgi:hypothetical protein
LNRYLLWRSVFKWRPGIDFWLFFLCVFCLGIFFVREWLGLAVPCVFAKRFAGLQDFHSQDHRDQDWATFLGVAVPPNACLILSLRSKRSHPRSLGPRLSNLSWDGGAEKKIPVCKAQRQQRVTRGCKAHSRATSGAGIQTTQVATNDAGMQTTLAAKSDAGAKSTLAARAIWECRTRGQQRVRQGCAAHGQQRAAHKQQRATRGGGPKAIRAQRRLARGARRETLLHEIIFPLGLPCCSAAGSSACASWAQLLGERVAAEARDQAPAARCVVQNYIASGPHCLDFWACPRPPAVRPLGQNSIASGPLCLDFWARPWPPAARFLVRIPSQVGHFAWISGHAPVHHSALLVRY